MKIAVCVKEVPDASASRSLDSSTGRLVRGSENVLNPFDGHAIEAALQTRESAGDVEVVAVCMGPESAGRTLQKALALGADRAVHVCDEALAGSDVLATARTLAAVIARDSFDLVLLGQQGSDSDCWTLAGVLAELLEMPLITQASSLTLEGTTAVADRQTEHGYETLKAPLPALVSVSDAINEPRYPSLKEIIGAKRKPSEKIGIGELGLSADEVGTAGSGTSVLAQNAPPSKEGGIKIEDDGNGAEKIVEFLAEQHLI